MDQLVGYLVRKIERLRGRLLVRLLTVQMPMTLKHT